MNPYLEQERVWHDFHERFMPAAADLLAAQVDPNYVVRIDERLYVHELPASTGTFLGRADVAVTRPPESTGRRDDTAVLEAPTQVGLPRVDVERLSFVEVRDRESWQVVTVLELLSPANKYAGPDREQYLAKRAQILSSPAHFIELDLLRGGPRLPLEGLADCDYYALVSRSEDRPRAGVWPIRLRDRLPILPVPLRAPDADARLDLQAVLHRVYDAARYQTYIYRGQPSPRLSAADAAWAHQLIPPQPDAR
jgi:hypothetical protein